MGGDGRDDDSRHLRPPVECQATAEPELKTEKERRGREERQRERERESYHDCKACCRRNSGVCTRSIPKEREGIDVSNWESFVHCRTYGSHENGALTKARINIEIK